MQQHALQTQGEWQHADGPPPNRIGIVAAQVENLRDQENGSAEEQAPQEKYDFGQHAEAADKAKVEAKCVGRQQNGEDDEQLDGRRHRVPVVSDQ